MKNPPPAAPRAPTRASSGQSAGRNPASGAGTGFPAGSSRRPRQPPRHLGGLVQVPGVALNSSRAITPATARWKREAPGRRWWSTTTATPPGLSAATARRTSSSDCPAGKMRTRLKSSTTSHSPGILLLPEVPGEEAHPLAHPRRVDRLLGDLARLRPVQHESPRAPGGCGRTRCCRGRGSRRDRGAAARRRAPEPARRSRVPPGGPPRAGRRGSVPSCRGGRRTIPRTGGPACPPAGRPRAESQRCCISSK